MKWQSSSTCSSKWSMVRCSSWGAVLSQICGKTAGCPCMDQWLFCSHHVIWLEEDGVTHHSLWVTCPESLPSTPSTHGRSRRSSCCPVYRSMQTHRQRISTYSAFGQVETSSLCTWIVEIKSCRLCRSRDCIWWTKPLSRTIPSCLSWISPLADHKDRGGD